MYGFLSIGSKRQIPFWAALIFFALATGQACENRFMQNEIASLSLDQAKLDLPLGPPIATSVAYFCPPAEKLASPNIWPLRTS